MAYPRILYLTLSMGFGSYLYRSITNYRENKLKMNKSKLRLHGQTGILNFNTGKSTNFYKPLTDKWWENFMKVYAQENNNSNNNEPCEEKDSENGHTRTNEKRPSSQVDSEASSSKDKCDNPAGRRADSAEDNDGLDERDKKIADEEIADEEGQETYDEEADEFFDAFVDKENVNPEDQEPYDYDDEANGNFDLDDQSMDTTEETEEINDDFLDIDTKHGHMTIYIVVELDSPNGKRKRCPPYSPMSTADRLIPTRTIIQHQDVFVVVDSRTKTSWWSIEKIDRCKVAESEHNHLEILDIQCLLPQGVELGHSDNEDRPRVQSIVRPKQHEVDGQLVCDQCLRSIFWKVFHQYVAYLTKLYPNVYVCSGCLRLDPEHPRQPTHFFKIISCRNMNGTFRYECYQVGIHQRQCTTPILKNFIVSREQLEKAAGVEIFDHVPRNMITDKSTHPLFVYSEN